MEKTESVRLLMWILSVEPGQLCDIFLPSLENLLHGLLMNTTTLSDTFFQTFVGDIGSFDVETNWYGIVLILSWGNGRLRESCSDNR